jgi:hypothetical protein
VLAHLWLGQFAIPEKHPNRRIKPAILLRRLGIEKHTMIKATIPSVCNIEQL